MGFVREMSAQGTGALSSRRAAGLVARLSPVLVAFSLAACGETERNSGDGEPAEPLAVPEVTSVEELCTVFPTVWAAHMARCFGGDPETWSAVVEAPCGPVIESEAAGRIDFNPDNARACLEGLRGVDCSFDARTSRTCANLVLGSVPAREPCQSMATLLQRQFDECESGTYCDWHGPGCEASCRAYAGEGVSCAGNYNTTVCLPGLSCDNELAECQVPSAEGEACTGTYDCQSALYCDAEAGTEGTCRPAKTEGSCRGARECAPNSRCVEGSCVPPKPVGAPCTVGLNECAGQCSDEGTCQVIAAYGERCGGVGNGEVLHCEPGLFCPSETKLCTPRLEVGASCPTRATTRSACADIPDGTSFCEPEEDICIRCDESATQ